MQMTNSEIVRRYKAADDRRKMIRILAELNACHKEEIRKILREAGLDVPATGNRYTAAKKEAEETEASGSKRKQAKLTEKGRRLLKNEESTECSDLSAPGARTEESPYGLLPDAYEAQIGWCPEQKVGICQQKVGTVSEKKAAPMACQPAEPVDIWDEDTIKYAKEELRRLNELIEAMEQDVKRKQLEIQANKCKTDYYRLWLQNMKGGMET